jgi:hypothetical protein
MPRKRKVLKEVRLCDVIGIASDLPLKLSGESRTDGEAEVIDSADDKTIGWTANSFSDHGGGYIDDEDRANARLLVHAANNILPLFEAAQTMKHFIESIDFSEVDGITYDDIPFAEWEKVLKSAGLVKLGVE